MISQDKIKKQYQDWIDEFGATPKGVGWGEGRLQRSRYLIALTMAKWTGQSVIEVGCGYGALVDIIKERNIQCQYKGYDLIESTIEEAKKLHPGYHFEAGDLFDPSFKEKADYVIASGVFSLKMDNALDYVKSAIEKLYQSCEKGMTFNLLTSKIYDQVNDNMRDKYNFFDPGEILNYCLTITPFVRLHHDYAVEDFTVFMYR